MPDPSPFSGDARVDRLFADILHRWPLGCEGTTLILVTHILPDKEAFVRVLTDRFGRVGIVAKPNSINPASHAALGRLATFLPLAKADLAQNRGLDCVEAFAGSQSPVVIVDMGGYFAPCAHALAGRFGQRFFGIVEDTANGHARYGAARPAFPVMSVARSALKEPEDIRVGQSIVESLTALLPSTGRSLPSSRCLVIGFGRIGRNVALELRRWGLRVMVHDRDPLAEAQAYAFRFETPGREAALRRADVIVCATGCHALATADLAVLPDGCAIATVTSPDDELCFSALDQTWHSERMQGHVTELRSRTSKRRMTLLNHGLTLNFLHGAPVGPPIYLVQAGVLHALALLTGGARLPDGVSEPSFADQRTIARLWCDLFLRDPD